jgi:glycerol-3-phosphate cytidylyltransferase-like family protein
MQGGGDDGGVSADEDADDEEGEMMGECGSASPINDDDDDDDADDDDESCEKQMGIDASFIRNSNTRTQNSTKSNLSQDEKKTKEWTRKTSIENCKHWKAQE